MSGASWDLDLLIDRAVRGEAGREELERLSEWRAESPENERRYARTVRLLEMSGVLGGLTEGAAGTTGAAGGMTESRRPSAGELLGSERMPSGAAAGPTVPTDSTGRIAESEVAAPRPTVPADSAGWNARSEGRGRRRLARVAPWAIAAAAVLALLVTRTVVPPASPGAATVRTGPTELATVELEDGSVVRLGPSSALDLVPASDDRVVALEGRAFFDVASVPGSRFRVRTSVGEAVVLGTQFELDVSADELQLLVVEGRVALAAGGRDVEVNGGEMSGIVGDTVLVPRRIADSDTRLQWAGTFLVFRSTPLREAVAEVERVYGVEVTITDASIAERTVTGTFVDRTAREVLDVLCSIGDVRCQHDGITTTITP